METWSLEQSAAEEEQVKFSQLVRSLSQATNPDAAGNTGNGEPVNEEEEMELQLSDTQCTLLKKIMVISRIIIEFTMLGMYIVHRGIDTW